MAILPVRQIRKIEVEPLFAGFVRSYGGRVLKEHISNVNPPSNADYYFDYSEDKARGGNSRHLRQIGVNLNFESAVLLFAAV